MNSNEIQKVEFNKEELYTLNNIKRKFDNEDNFYIYVNNDSVKASHHITRGRKTSGIRYVFEEFQGSYRFTNEEVYNYKESILPFSILGLFAISITLIMIIITIFSNYFDTNKWEEICVKGIKLICC